MITEEQKLKEESKTSQVSFGIHVKDGEVETENNKRVR